MNVTIDEVLNVDVVDFQALTRCCRRGLHENARPDCWKIIMGFYPPSTRQWARIEAARLQEYTDVLSACGLDLESSASLKDEITRAVDVDVPRTMPSLNFFLGESDELSAARREREGDALGFTPAQEALRRILITSANVNKALGYVQGMNEYVAHLLYAFAKGNSCNVTSSVEADAFFCFQTLLSHLGDDFSRSFDFDATCGLTSTMRLFDNVLRFFDPQLFHFMESLGISAEHYALRWIMLLFTQEFNIADALRVWDFLLSFGDQIRNAAFFVAASMCYHLRSSILSAETMGDVIPLLHEYPSGDVNEFLRVALRWIARFDFDLIEKLKQATPEEVQGLRRFYGLEVDKSFAQIMQGWISSVF
ncbi:Gtpase activator-like protein [Leptomonas pyrrhocoris]|uniref:Gtpase activator-like protein n=1 Tax=Leptomonas pyrrhocoris TaxID=157538 RepID=A0A0M9G6F6_LEPPY|nr:Gtpase activator-like protein [Leptomonas pyrrhocoris]KPA83367.1 Gtpase activator-like protein [Leptomonas pyrrhocoris]|eukprot:XP_015661806.1 Gtpase activator-like protein [Leptomonas pyrrhocoris]